jgi:hypothetical protein
MDPDKIIPDLGVLPIHEDIAYGIHFYLLGGYGYTSMKRPSKN